MAALIRAVQQKNYDQIRELIGLQNPDQTWFQDKIQEMVRYERFDLGLFQIVRENITINNFIDHLRFFANQSVQRGDWEIIKTLVENFGYDPSHLLRFQAKTIDHYQFLVDLGVDINNRFECGNTVLHGLPHLDFDVCQFLVDQGLDVHAVNNNREGVLHHHVSISLARLLLSQGVDVNLLGPDGSPSIFYQYDPKVLDLFLEHGADIHACDNNGNNMFHRMMQYLTQNNKSLPLAKYLVQHGVDINARNQANQTPLAIYFTFLSPFVQDHLSVFMIQHGAIADGVQLSKHHNKWHNQLIKQNKRIFNINYDLVDALMNDDVAAFDAIPFDLELFKRLSFLIQSVEMYEAYRRRMPPAEVGSFFEYVLEDQVELVQHMIDQELVELNDQWWLDHAHEVVIQSDEMLELLNPPIGHWHLLGEKMKLVKSRGMTDRELEKRGCEVAKKILCIRRERMAWLKVFILGQGWFFDLPSGVVPIVVCFMV